MSSKHDPLDIVLLFDVEDAFSPPEVGNDDSIKELAEILTEEKLTGTFLFIAERAALLKARGRMDVIAAVNRHHVGLHSRARHPSVPEYVVDLGWDEAVAEVVRRERQEVAVIEDVFGQPCCALSAHNVFTSPMSHRAAAALGKPYIYSLADAPPLHSLSWYAGALSVATWPDHTDPERTRAHFLGLEDAYPDDGAFEQAYRDFWAWVDRAQDEGHPFMSVIMYHPQRVRLRDYIDHFWSPNGINIPQEQWGRRGWPRRYRPDEVAAALRNFRRLAHSIRSDGRLRPITVPEMETKYGRQPVAFQRHEIVAAAIDVAQADAVRLQADFSPAELCVAMAESLVEFERSGALPAKVAWRDVLGPTASPVIEPELRTCTWPELLERAKRVLREVERTGHLPANVGPVFERTGINHLHVAFAKCISTLSAGERPGEISFKRTPRYPPEAETIGRRYLSVAEGELVAPDLNAEGMYRHGKLQTWTLKSALAKR